jgi:hypothetical protein
MSKNKRPMCITVIGWFWIIIGVVIFLGSVMMLFSFFVVRIDQINQSILIPLVLIPISILIIASGISFLKLKPWTRKILEILSWLAIILSFGDGIFGVVHLSSYKPLLWDGLFCIPFAIIIKYLRGNTVKNSFEFIAEPVAKPIATPDYL